MRWGSSGWCDELMLGVVALSLLLLVVRKIVQRNLQRDSYGEPTWAHTVCNVTQRSTLKVLYRRAQLAGSVQSLNF